MCRAKKIFFFLLSNESCCTIKITTTLKSKLTENQNTVRKYSRGIFFDPSERFHFE